MKWNVGMDKDVMGLQSIIHTIEKESLMYFKVLAHVYADDTVIMVESADELQCTLIEFKYTVHNGSWKWKLTKTS